MSGSFERFIITTGGEEERQINERRDAFFGEVITSLGLALGNPFTQMETKNIGEESPEGFRPSDDALYRLLVFDELLAMVMDRRNDMNNHEVTFWQVSPSSSCLEQIKRVLSYDPTTEFERY